jgi:hypothetical protein
LLLIAIFPERRSGSLSMEQAISSVIPSHNKASSEHAARNTAGAASTTIHVHLDVLKEGEVEELTVRPSTSSAEIIRKVLEKFHLEKSCDSYCLAFIKGLKKSRSFRSSHTKPRVLLSQDCPLFLGLGDHSGRYFVFSFVAIF